MCRGAIVCFLNDDDVWRPGKLSFVINRFHERSNLGYLRHSLVYVDALGKPAPQLAGHRRLPFLSYRGSVYYPNGAAAVRDPLAGLWDPGDNDSCIAILRQVATNTIDYLRRTPAGEDLFFFYTALASRMGLEISSRKLTEYRVHDLGSSVPGAGEDKARSLPSFKPSQRSAQETSR